MALAKFDITCNPGGGTVVVNGDDISGQIVAFRLEAASQEVPRLTLQLVGEGTLTGEGIVEVATTTDDWAQTAADFLDHLDPAEVEKVTLDAAGWGDTNMTAGLIATIRGMLVGEPPRG